MATAATRVAFVTLVCCIVANCTRHYSGAEEKKWHTHFKKVHDFSCSVPQPRLIYVDHEHVTPGVTYVPHATVLHRCDSSAGFCQSSAKKCTAIDDEIVTEVFSVRPVNPLKRPYYQTLQFVNHTRCGCQYSMRGPR